jgi:lipopolysaccharide transport system permease protein
VSRIYFPRLLLPLGAALSFVLDLLVGLAVSVVLMAVYDHWPGAAIVTLPFFFVLLLFASLGVSFLFAALNAQYRDVQYVVPLVMQVWLFATPVAYAISLIPEQYRLLYSVNPMVSVVDGFRWALLDTTAPTPGQVAVSSASALLLFVIGAFVFRRMERTFADVL